VTRRGISGSFKSVVFHRGDTEKILEKGVKRSSFRAGTRNPGETAVHSKTAYLTGMKGIRSNSFQGGKCSLTQGRGAAEKINKAGVKAVPLKTAERQ